MSCNDNGNVPAEWDGGRIFIDLRPNNAVQIVMKDTGVIYLGTWQASKTRLAMVFDTGFLGAGEMIRLRPIEKTMEHANVIGQTPDGDDTIKADGFNVKCIVVKR
jgi:hypothetical protein